LKIGLLIYGSLNVITGGNIYDQFLVDYLESRGDQVETISLPLRNYWRHLADNYSRELRARLINLEVDLLIEDELCHPSLFLLTQRIKPRVKYPVVSIVHHLRSSEVHPAWIIWFYKLVENRYLNSIDGFIFNSQTTQKSVQSFVPKLPSHVIAYPGGDRISSPINEGLIRQRAQQNRPLHFIFLGSITHRKQPHVLMRACSHLDNRKIFLTFVGNQAAEPAYAQVIQRMVGDLSVMFIDTLSSDELSKLLSRQDILVVPSTYEGFGIVYLEGMGFGLPAIATTAGAAGETIKHGENGFLIQPGDKRALADHIGELAMDRQKLIELSLAALQTYQNGPTWEGMGQQAHQFLHKFE